MGWIHIDGWGFELPYMMRAYCSSWYWRNGFSIVRALAALLSAFGALWLVIEITEFFRPTSAPELREGWWLFLIAGVGAALWINRPRHSVSCKLSGRDVVIEVYVGDLFEKCGEKDNGAYVIGSNTTFDTASSVIDANSVQGQFAGKYYDSSAHLDGDIDKSVRGAASTSCGYTKPGKSVAYPLGTVAQVSARGKTAYLLAIASINESGVANATFDDLKSALPALWEHISNRGRLDAIVMPVLGTGFSRLPQSREEIIREIIDSFVAACAMKRFSPALTIVVHGPDFYRNEVDLPELGRYLRHVCRYTQFSGSRSGEGTPL